MLFESTSKFFTSDSGQPIKVHLISTGGVIVKTKFREAKRTGWIGMIEFILDKKFTEWMPIWVLVIEHPEGIFVIDTGENANVNNPGYFKSSGGFANWFDTTQFKFKVDRDEEIDRQLQSLGISIKDVKKVILTHLHLDHIDGLRYFPETPVLVNKAEWEKPFGDLPKLYPDWFQPALVDLNESFDVFDEAFYITETKDIALVRTPGHTWHHCSVVLKTKECYLFFAADVCYSQRQLIENKYSGTNASHKLAKNTYSKLRSFCSDKQVLFIPSHEAEAAQRLKELQYIDLG